MMRAYKKYEEFYSPTCCSPRQPQYATSGVECLPEIISVKGLWEHINKNLPKVHFPPNLISLLEASFYS